MTFIPFKAVAVDMDGTFENDDKKFDHERFEKVLTQLREHHSFQVVGLYHDYAKISSNFWTGLTL